MLKPHDYITHTFFVLSIALTLHLTIANLVFVGPDILPSCFNRDKFSIGPGVKKLMKRFAGQPNFTRNFLFILIILAFD